jgi:hypothetical protein
MNPRGPTLLAAHDATPRGLVVKPARIPRLADAIGNWWQPVGYYRRMYENSPSSKDTDSASAQTIAAQCEPTSYVAPCCDDPGDDCGFVGDPQIRRWASLRFCSPDPNYRDVNPALPGDYWCLRSSLYYVYIEGRIFRGWTDVVDCSGDGEGEGNFLTGVRVTAWLLDQYFDYTQINWTNRAQILQTGFKLDLQVQASIGYQNGCVKFTQNFLVELPNLADQSGPPRIYGALLMVERDPASPYPNETVYAFMQVFAYRENSRRGADSDTGILLPPVDVSGGQYGILGGYHGEWEDNPYLPPTPYTWHLKNNFSPTEDTRVYCPKNGSVDAILLAADADGPNSALTWYKSAGPYHGVLSGTMPNVTYTPTAGWTGWDYIYYYVKDADGRQSNTSIAYFYTYEP